MSGATVVPTIDWPDWAQIVPQRREHVRRVWEMMYAWAGVMGTPAKERQRWRLAVGLHDSLKDASPAVLRELAPAGWNEDALRHGPAAAVIAESDGVSDQGVLDAVRYHSVGYAGWDQVGRMLYMADYLEPGRPFEIKHRSEIAARVPSDPAAVMLEVAQLRIRRLVGRGWPLVPETVEFWNALRCRD